MNPVVVFRCDAGAELGLGHLIRCRTLAGALQEQDISCVMLGPAVAYRLDSDRQTFSHWRHLAYWQTADLESARLLDACKDFGASVAVLDDYRVDESFQTAIRRGGMRWLQFDGTARKPLWADLVLNANPGVVAGDYANMLRIDDTSLLLGPAYAVLRPEFAAARGARAFDEPRRILVICGGGDDRGAIQTLLSASLDVTPPSIRLSVVAGAAHPRIDALREWIDAHGQQRVELLVDPPEMAPLMASCDLGLMAGGTATYEAACLGLPMVLVSIAENQEPQCRAWQALGAAFYLGPLWSLDVDKLRESLQELLVSASLRRNSSMRGSEIVDGLGARRVAKRVVSLLEMR